MSIEASFSILSMRDIKPYPGYCTIGMRFVRLCPVMISDSSSLVKKLIMSTLGHDHDARRFRKELLPHPPTLYPLLSAWAYASSSGGLLHLQEVSLQVHM
jgi:hypothetical protein